MTELNKQIDYVTKCIKRVCNEFPNDNEMQYKGFMYLLHNAKLEVDCSQVRYIKLRKLFIRKSWLWRESTDHIAYENAVSELLGVFVPIQCI